MPGPLWALPVALFTGLAASANPEPISLPSPTGPDRVGTLVWHWSDPGRRDNGSARELMAQLWYPAETDAAPTSYRPLSGGRYDHVTAHAVAGASFNKRPQRSQLVVLCPGRGTSRNFYTTVATDLASHGYAVLAIDSPTLGYTVFPDGREVDPSNDYRPSFELITGPYEKVDEFFAPAVELGLADLQFALKQLRRLNRRDPGRRLISKLDLRRIGVFGHSLGGRLCGALAGSDPRVAALAAMEGVPPREVRRGGLRAASLMLYSSELPEAMALPNIREVYDHRKADATILRLEGFGHNSVTDRPLLFPDSFNYAVDARRALTLTANILRSFFDGYLRDTGFSPQQLAAEPEITLIETSIP